MVTEESLSDVGSVSDVQTALGDPDGDHYQTAVIERALTNARIVVANTATDSATDGQLQEAVIAVAAYRTATSSPMENRKEAAEVLKETNVEDYLDRLESDKDDALNAAQGPAFQLETF